MEARRRDNQRQIPWLLTSHGQNLEKHSFYNLTESQFHANTIPELNNKHMCISTHDGWLVLVDFNGTCCIWHPLSNSTIDLPHLHDSQEYNKCILSKPPTDPECHVLFITSLGFERAFCKIGDQDYVYEKLQVVLDLQSVTVSNGQMYGLTRTGACNRIAQFVTVHFGETALEFRPIMIEEQIPWEIPIMAIPFSKGGSYYLMESPYENQLLLVFQTCDYSVFQDIYEFIVFRVDMDKKEMVELDNIDHLSIFITYEGAGICCPYSDGVKKNCIYYTDFSGQDLYVYDYNDRAKTLLLPCPQAKVGSKKFWMEHDVSLSFIN